MRVLDSVAYTFLDHYACANVSTILLTIFLIMYASLSNRDMCTRTYIIHGVYVLFFFLFGMHNQTTMYGCGYAITVENQSHSALCIAFLHQPCGFSEISSLFCLCLRCLVLRLILWYFLWFRL